MRYEIRIRGVLSETLLGGFPDLDARAEDGDMVLAGPLPDQAALHGVLNESRPSDWSWLKSAESRPL